MVKTHNDIYKKFGKVILNLSDNIDNSIQGKIDELTSELSRLNKILLETKDQPEEKVKTKFFTANQMADFIGVDRETIYRWCKQLQIYKNKRKCPKFGNSYRFTEEDREMFKHFITMPDALCITNTIYVNSKKDEIAVFSKDNLYSIVKENSRWYYLLNKDWGGTFRISKKQFKKNFSVKGEIDYDVRLYI